MLHPVRGTYQTVLWSIPRSGGQRGFEDAREHRIRHNSLDAGTTLGATHE